MGFTNIVDHFVKTTTKEHQFFIDEMVTDSIQN